MLRAQLQLNVAASRLISPALVTITAAAMPITNSGRVGDHAEVEQHPDREEEQAEQDRAERLDVAFELMPVGRFGEHHAGDESAERRPTSAASASPPPRRSR